MKWPWRRRGSDPPAGEEPSRTGTPGPAAGRDPIGVEMSVTVDVAYPPCSRCGRTRFPLVGGWDPPICADCDAAINEDTIQAEEIDR